MKRGGHYTHPRFMDVTFVVLKCGYYGGRWKIKADWYVRGRSVHVQTKHELSREKTLEFIQI